MKSKNMFNGCVVSKTFCLLVGALLLFSCLGILNAAPLVVQEPVVVPESKGGFDYLQVDAEKRRLGQAHSHGIPAREALGMQDLLGRARRIGPRVARAGLRAHEREPGPVGEHEQLAQDARRALERLARRRASQSTASPENTLSA